MTYVFSFRLQNDRAAFRGYLTRSYHDLLEKSNVSGKIVVTDQVVLLHEKLTLLAGTGTILTLIGSFLSEYKAERKGIKNRLTK